MATFLVRRLLWSIFVVYAAVTIVFVLVNVVGDPARGALGPRANAEQLAQFRAQHGLDKPLLEQYVSYFSNAARGDLGRALRDGEPVAEVIATRLPRTLLLGALAMLFELVIGLGLGILAAAKRNTLVDSLTMGATFLGVSAPTFITGLVILYVLGFLYGWFPIGGYGVDAGDHLYHAILPALTLAIFGAASYARLMRGELLETYRADYVRTAKAKGASESRTLFVHAVRNALLPIAVLASLQLATLVSGAIITEQIYSWPGMGRLAVEAIAANDPPLVTGVVMVVAAAVQVGSLLADIALAALDPRIRLEGR